MVKPRFITAAELMVQLGMVSHSRRLNEYFSGAILVPRLLTIELSSVGSNFG